MRVFILPFETLPRRADEALPLLRWRLKKSVPFDVDETVVSWMRQNGREGNLEMVTAVARQRIIREYEEIVESVEANGQRRPEFHARHSAFARRARRHASGAHVRKNLTTVIVQAESLRVSLHRDGGRSRAA